MIAAIEGNCERSSNSVSSASMSSFFDCAYAKIRARLSWIFSLSFIESSTVFSSGMSILTGKSIRGAFTVVFVEP